VILQPEDAWQRHHARPASLALRLFIALLAQPAEHDPPAFGIAHRLGRVEAGAEIELADLLRGEREPRIVANKGDWIGQGVLIMVATTTMGSTTGTKKVARK